MEQNKCNKCGRPIEYAKEPQCNYTEACMDEYCCPKLGSIKETEPDCRHKAVIPSVTVDSVEGITNLANCFVHVNDINTTFYIDDKHRLMITWAGPVDIPGYDMEHNPEGFRDQIVTDKEKNIAVIYDKHGKGYTFGIEQGYDITEIINNKLEQMAADGELQDIIQSYLDAYAMVVFDTVADMKASTVLADGSYAKTLGYANIDDKGGAVYKIVDDNSLVDDGGSVHDMANGLKAVLIKGAILTPQTFGIFGDGVTNYTTRIKYFLQFCSDNDIKTYFPAGTYILSSETAVIRFKEGKGISIEGDNQATIFKRISGTLGPTKWNRLLMFRADSNNTVDTGDINIKNIMIDSNRRGQSNATTDYTYEGSGNISINGHGSSYISNVYINNIYCYDPVADDLTFAGSPECCVKNVFINNFLGEHREGTRHDIDFTGYCSGNVYVTNSKGANLTFEMNQKNPATGHNAYVNNCEFKHINFDGKTNLVASNLAVKERFIISNNMTCTIENSSFNLDGTKQRSYILGSNAKFDNCQFYSRASSEYSTSSNPTDVSYVFIRDGSNVTIQNSSFEYMDTPIASYAKDRNYMISSAVNEESACTINIDNTTFKGSNIYAVFCYANNTFNITNCDFGDTNNIYIKRVLNYTDPTVTLNNIKLNPSKAFCYLLGQANLSGDNLVCNPTNFYILGTDTHFNNANINLHRKIYITQALDTTYLTSLLQDSEVVMKICQNDEFILNSANNPQKWIALTKIARRPTGANSSIENHVNELFNVVSENARGITADRPTCYLSNGFQYYDETLSKPIWYAGSGWVDASGTSV